MHRRLVALEHILRRTSVVRPTVRFFARQRDPNNNNHIPEVNLTQDLHPHHPDDPIDLATTPTPITEVIHDRTVDVEVKFPDELVIPGAERGTRTLACIFTCKICDERAVKQFTERAYKYGVVIAQCPRCKKQHLLADRLGYFTEKSTDLKDIAEEHGERFTSVEDGDVEIDLEALLGTSKYLELLDMAAEQYDTIDPTASTKEEPS